MKLIKKALFFVIAAFSTTTFINISIMYWVPTVFPVSSFSVVRILLVAFVEKKYYLVPISFLICIILFITAFSFNKERIILPVCLSAYLLFDSIFLLYLLVEYWFVYDYFLSARLVQIVINVIIIVLIAIYFYLRIRERFMRKLLL